MPLLNRCFFKTASIFGLFIISLSNLQAADTPPTDLSIHSQLVKHALTMDAYNKRCRGMSINKYFNQVNRLFVTKYSLTANNFIKKYMGDGSAYSVRQFKQTQAHSFNQSLIQLKGCKAAKNNGWLSQLQSNYKTHYNQAEESNWAPILDE